MSRLYSPGSTLLPSMTLSESPSSTPTLVSPTSLGSDEATTGDEKVKPRPRARTLRAASIALVATSFRGKMQRTRRQKEDPVLAINTQITSVAELVSPLSSGAQGTALKIAQYTTNALFDGLPELVKVLQEVAAVHPFIALAVGAFRVAIELDLKRRENDKKINLLFVEMRDMMTALVELQNVKEADRLDMDGKTVQDRLQGLVDLIESDILDCANVCDAYAKKGTAARVLGSLRWNEKLQQYVKRFTKHRADIEFTVAIHLGINIDIANRKLDSLDAKIDNVLEYLQGCSSPEEKEMAAFVERRGGRDAILSNERLLLELVAQRTMSNGPNTEGRWARRQNTIDIQELKLELSEEPDISIARNWNTFERKFEMQERELERIQEIVHEENQLVIKSVAAGPHDKIRDNDLHNIWREMRWRGNVKARHFVLALRDYCLERLDKMRKNESTFVDCDRPTNINEHDEWTLDYISVTRLQAIIEAFDDDASGFITVAEVNTFVATKPPDWSLLHWMAYWAIGWQMTMTRYVTEIDNLLDKMFSVKAHVLPANRRSVEQYLDTIWSPITELTTGFRRIERHDVVEERFQSHVSAEENRLRTALEAINYDIDAADTLQLVMGPGRVEKYLFPLLWLLLKRDYEILRLSRSVVIHKDELWDCGSTLKWVFRAVSDRCTNLENLFKQQNLDPGQQFKVFASELFRYWHDSTPLWSTERLREAHYAEKPYNDSEEDPYVDPSRILNHPVENPSNPLASSQYFETLEDRQATEPLKLILGQWSGYIGDASAVPCEPMMSLKFHVSPRTSNEFVASGTIPLGTRFNISGRAVSHGDSGLVFQFLQEYAARYWPRIFRGQLVDGGRELSGTWTCRENDTAGTFIFRRLPPNAMRFWLLPIDGEYSKPMALWRFAVAAVRDQVRRKMLSVHLLRERQAIRQRFLRAIRTGLSTSIADETERQTLIRCYRLMTPAEARYYCTVYESMRSIAPKHFGISCANCRSEVYGARTMCLDCGIRTTVDLCGKPECREATIGPDRRDDLVMPHLPSHRIMRVRQVIHRHREFGKVYRAAQAALIRAEEALADADDVSSPQLHGGHSRHQSVSARLMTERLVDRELSCVGCKKRVSRPCWYCIECDDECFVCTTCESSRTSFSCGHKPNHGLVRCALPRDDMVKAADLEWSHSRIDNLETKLADLQRDSASRFDSLDGRLTGLANHSVELETMHATSNQKLETLGIRLQHIESLLAAIASKL